MIYGMSKQGTTIFVTTHYMDEADYCDRLALIYRGRIIAEGTPHELRKEHMKRHVLEIEVDDIVAAVSALSAGGMEAAVFGSLIHATVDDPGTAVPAIKELIARSGIKVRNIEEIVPSLEDVFVTLIEIS
jgi:ABC-2 type transport system ATP-binding protein